ncbi:uncharacterized protein LOC142660246 [Rhinoderma darwinii]|uniref:uncharacterized protein LOC142660246 n=1 Tax=Rhinoderma darwinii TaxID=43563 RepID=UPI003F666D49
MPSCVVRGCGRKKNLDPTIIRHCFPKEPERIKLWLQQTGQYGTDIDEMVQKVYLGKLYDIYRMCSLHFTNDSYRYDGYRRILNKNAIPTIFNTITPTAVESKYFPSVSLVSTNIPSVSYFQSGPSGTSSEQHIPSAPPAEGQKPSCSGTVRTYQVEFSAVHPDASSQSTIQQMTLVPVVPQRVIFQACGISQKSNSLVSDGSSSSVTVQPTATTVCEATKIHSASSGVGQQSSVSRTSTSSMLRVPVSSSFCLQQSTSAISQFTAPSCGSQLKPLKSAANLLQSTSAPVILQKKPPSSVLTNSVLPLDIQLRPAATSSSTKTSSSTSSCPIISLSPASSPVISTSGFDSSPYKTLTAPPINIPLTVVRETKPFSMTVLPVSGNVSSVTQTPPPTSNLGQKPPSMSVVHIPVKTLTSQSTIPASLPPSKKRKLEENIIFMKQNATSPSDPSVLPSRCMSQSSVNTGKLFFVSSSTPLVQPPCLIHKPKMVDKGVNTDFFTNRRSCCISTDPMHRKRNAHTQTKIYRKHRKVMCTLLVPNKPTNDSDSESTVSIVHPEDLESSDSGNEPCEVLESVVKVKMLMDSEVDVDVPTSSDKKQEIHIKKEYETNAGQENKIPTNILSSRPFKSTFMVPDFDTSTLRIEPNIKLEEDQIAISSYSQNITYFVSQNPKIERISPIPNEPFSPVCKNPILWQTSAMQTNDEMEDPYESMFYNSELTEDEDESFLVPSDVEDEDDVKHVFQDLDSPVENLVEDEKFIVFESCLKKLIMMIPCMSETKCMSPLTQYRKETIGSYLSIEVRCRSGHTSYLWESQPRHGYQPLGNVLLSAAVLFSGSSFLKSQHMFKLLNLKSIDKSTYYKNQSMYLFPAINHHWREEQKAVIQSVQEKPLCLAGDQQLDNPGPSAKYCIYSLMDVASKKMCSFSVERVTPQVTLAGLEKIGFQKAIGELQTMNADVKIIVTDRNVAIQEILKENYPGIVHQFDLWHFSKSIGNEVLMAAKHKDCEILSQWVEAIRNHIWWCSCTCSKNPDLLIQKWKSVIQHVTNVHEWDGDGDCKACHHPPLPEDVLNNTNWLEKDSAAYKKLKQIVENTSLLKNLKQLSFQCHTGELEIYHSTCLKYRPKTLHFFMDAMVARTQLAALDHNRNVNKVKAMVKYANSSGDAFDSMEQILKFSKGQKAWVNKTLYEPTCQNFLFDIMNDVIALVKEEKTFQ